MNFLLATRRASLIVFTATLFSAPALSALSMTPFSPPCHPCHLLFPFPSALQYPLDPFISIQFSMQLFFGLFYVHHFWTFCNEFLFVCLSVRWRFYEDKKLSDSAMAMATATAVRHWHWHLTSQLRAAYVRLPPALPVANGPNRASLQLMQA